MAKGGNGKGRGGGGGSGGGGSSGDGPLSLNGNKKDNTLIGSDWGDTIRGNDGDDVLIGMGNDKDGGTDLLIGGDGDDILIGDSGTVDDPGAEGATDGRDRLFGGQGEDALYGGGGDDELQGGDGIDLLDGGSGYDIARYSADDYAISVAVDGDETGFLVTFQSVDFLGSGEPGPTALDGATEQARNIEGIVGTYYDDTIDGSGAWTGTEVSADGFVFTFYGYYGDDTITGGSGSDHLDGGPGDDIINGNGGDDTIVGGHGADTLSGGADADTFVYHSASEGGDSITDFSGDGGDGDVIDLTALNLDGSSESPDPVGGGFVFVDGNRLFVDLDGGGSGDGTADDILIATFTDGGAGFDLTTDVLV